MSTPFDSETQILYEDNHLILINKKSGQIVQADNTNDKPLLEEVRNYIKIKYNKPGKVYLGLPHRLDRPTTGIVIFTKTSKALSRMAEKFKTRDIQKTYWALVSNPLQENSGRLINYLQKNAKNNKSTAYPNPKEGAKKAILTYKRLEKLDNFSLVEINLETGRHHQIRSQLSFLGNPIKGDVKYGFKRGNQDRGICLHARSIEFQHPTTKVSMKFIAPILSEEPIWGFVNENK